jgi:hypothetical protein
MFKCCLIRLCVFKNRVLWKIVVFLAQAQKWPDFKTARLRKFENKRCQESVQTQYLYQIIRTHEVANLLAFYF